MDSRICQTFAAPPAEPGFSRYWLGSNWLGLLYPRSPLWCVKRFPQLVALLQVQPKFSAVSKYGGQHQCCVGRNCTAICTQLIDGFSTDAHRFSQLCP